MKNTVDEYVRWRHVRTELIHAIKDGYCFYLQRRSSVIKFPEQDLRIDLSTKHHPESGLSIGDNVMVHSSLEAPWDHSPVVEDVSYIGGYIVAFARIDTKMRGVRISAMFCILQDSLHYVTNPNSHYRLFKMKYGAVKQIPLYFTGCLEKIYGE